MRTKGFTIVELLIVMVIMGILFTLVFQTYTKISQISFRVEQEKVVTEELVFLSEVLQNLSEKNTIDWFQYSGALVASWWLTDKLYLTGEDGKITIQSSWDCKSTVMSIFDEEYSKKWCWIEMISRIWDTKTTTELTATGNVIFTKPIFKIIPFASEDEILDDPGLCKINYFACLHSDGFWLFTTAYTPTYSNIWANDVKHNVQQFFNL